MIGSWPVLHSSMTIEETGKKIDGAFIEVGDLDIVGVENVDSSSVRKKRSHRWSLRWSELLDEEDEWRWWVKHQILDLCEISMDWEWC